jgi:hypothetical protein
VILRRTGIACILMTFLAGAALTADFSGKWTGTLEFKTPDGENHSEPVILGLQQNSAGITGGVGYNEIDLFPIEKGEIDGKRLTFTVVGPNDQYNIDLTMVSKNLLKGTAKFVVSKIEGKLTLNKAQ